MGKKDNKIAVQETDLKTVETENTEENPTPDSEKKKNWLQRKVDNLKTPEGKAKAKKVAIGVGTGILGALTAFFAGAAWMAAADDGGSDPAAEPDESDTYTDVDSPIIETVDDDPESETDGEDSDGEEI